MPESISSQDAQYALDLVKAICEQVGPGIPASPQERERAEMIRKELETHLGAENVVVEEFTLAPDALLNTYPGVISMVVAVLLNISIGHINGISSLITAIAAFIFSVFMPLSFVLEFLLSYEVFDPLYPKKQSINVIGTLRKPGITNAKHLLILSGHHDSAPENTWIRYTGYGFYFLSGTFFIGMVTLVVVCLIQLVGVILGNEAVVRAGTLGWALLVFPILPAMIYAAFLTRGKKNGGIVPGAADNLSASATVVAMCRFLVQNPSYLPQDTEIRFISFGSEEAGLRGSRRYVQRHLNELKQLEARILNYEIVAYPEISIPDSDINGTVKYSPEMVKSVVSAAERAGVPYKMASGGLGAGYDAAPFCRAGLKAMTILLFKVPQQLLAFYHQDRDTPEVLSLEPFVNALKLTLEWVQSGSEK
jgi:hypothetical protein